MSLKAIPLALSIAAVSFTQYSFAETTGQNGEKITAISDLSNDASAIGTALAGPGLNVTNITLGGTGVTETDPLQLGTFDGFGFLFDPNDESGFKSGVVLSTGLVESAVLANGDVNSDSTSTDFDGTSNPLNDYAIITFEVTPSFDTLIMDFVFGSEEYNEYVNSIYNDQLTIVVDGTNCAKTPDDQIFSISTVNDAATYNPEFNPQTSKNVSSNPFLYINNDPGNGGTLATQMDGLTKRITCRAPVTPGVPTTVKVQIADAEDSTLDSWLFLKAQSLRSEPGSDYGDAPDTYQTLSSSSGASHTIKEGVYLGKSPSGDTNGFVDGIDDSAGGATDDLDDGVATFPQLLDSDSTYTVTVNATSINGSASTIGAWIDFNGNGTFETNEYTSATVNSGDFEQDITVTWSSIPVTPPIGETYVRFRIANSGINSGAFGGSLATGEVEDYKFTISGAADVTPPVVVINAVPGASIANQATYDISGTCAVGDGDVTVIVQDSDTSPVLPTQVLTCTSSGTWSATFDVSTIDDGTNAIEINASQTDGNNNEGNATQVVANKDTIPPSLTIESPAAANDSNKAAYDATGFCESGISNVTVAIANATPTTQDVTCNVGMWTATFDVSAIADGTDVITIDVSQTDNVGNSTAIQGIEDKDTVVPIVTIGALPNGTASNKNTYPVDGTCTNGDGNVSVTLPGAATPTKSVSCSSSTWSTTYNISAIADGANTISVNAAQTDTAGNVGNATQKQANKDATPPVVVINTPATVNQSNEATYPVSGTCTSSDGDVTVGISGATPPSQTATCSGGTWNAVFDVSALSEGANQLTVTANQADSVNNYTEATPKNANKDTTAPVVVITNLVNANFSNQASYPLTGTCTNGDGNVTASLTGASPGSQAVACSTGSWSATFDVTAVSDGIGTLIANANQTDAQSNAGTATQKTGNKDTVKPTLSIDGAPAEITNVDPISVTFNFSESVTGFVIGDIAVSKASVSNFSGSGSVYTADITPDGTGNITVTVADAAAADTFTNASVGDSVEISYDTDGDGLTNNVEVSLGTDPENADSDGDGITDDIEVGDPNAATDSDLDGVIDALDGDDDNDGIATKLEDANLDADNDPSTSPTDTDGDGTPNYLDTDSDNDNITDVIESDASQVDSDSDGLVDSIDVDVTGGTDADLDGIDDNVVATNTVGTTVQDYLNLDSDGDGIPDFLESGAIFTDTDSDGIDDKFDVDQTSGTDANMDGIDDNVDVVDTDNDLAPNFNDLDSDNDGLSDAVETGLTATQLSTDTDSDGIIDVFDVNSTGGTDADANGIDDNALASLADQDGDDIPNYIDVDSDNDGIPDFIEMGSSGIDTDGDGIDDAFDVDVTSGTDANNDGVDDALAPDTRDFDGDGVADYLDTDSDNDGIADGIEAGLLMTDSDGDGIVDSLDVDSTGGTDANGDGIDDAIALLNSDGNGEPDYRDRDSDADGIPDALEGNVDTDVDGIADYLDTDSDNDGITDGVELGASGVDTDGDGIDDSFDVDITGGVDANNDGVDDNALANLPDSDGDGIDDHLDADSDNDGIPDVVEGDISINSNVDNDANRNALDLDSDNDGLNDSVESGLSATQLSTDTDSDGIIDVFDVDSTGGTDADANGIDDNALASLADQDGDDIPNYIDVDSDNDGIPDFIEMGSSGIDTDGDGIDDAFDVDVTSGTDANNDGVDDALAPDTRDFDGDGVADYLDTDSDNDGIADGIEAGLLMTDSDGDGIVDSLDVDSTGGTDANGDGIDDAIALLNSDGNGEPDYRDRDSDADGIPDALEGNVDTDVDGIADYLDTDSDNDGITDGVELGVSGVDTDGDGIDDSFDVDITGGLDANNDGVDDDALANLPDSDGDGVPNHLDNDADNDGIPDIVEGSVDSDGDGIPNYLDTDSDNDGIADSDEGNIDSDNDTIPNYLDTDSDNDGISDINEGSVDSDLDGTPDYLDTSIDEDNDGIPDIIEGTADVDGDGIPNFLDTDSDNDGILDSEEFGLIGLDSDNDGIDDAVDVDSTGGIDVNNDGIDDDYIGINSDLDNAADYLDIDSDNDGIPDVVEALAFGALVFKDTDGDTIPDFRDPDSDNDGIADFVEANSLGVDNDGDGIDDAFDLDYQSGTDANSDGIIDAVTLDTDGDGIIDMFDLDSDNDGRLDSLESPTADSNKDGIADSTAPLVIDPADTDNDGIYDFRDLDSDGDGVFDIANTPEQAFDANGDGMIDITEDLDADGIDDSVDSDLNLRGAGGKNDVDKDGAVNAIDKDDDNDGISDIAEELIHIDGNSVVNTRMTASNGKSNRFESESNGKLSLTGQDTDGDRVINSRDADSDNDGIPDRIETDRPPVTGLDSDFDGIDDAYDVDATGGLDLDEDGVDDKFLVADTDNDGILDYHDLDSDNDGISDTQEQVAVPLLNIDADGDGIDDAIDVTYTLGIDTDKDGIDDDLLFNFDPDGDGILNYRDLDSDGDGIEDSQEGSGDSDGDGIPDSIDNDSDGDGIDDNIEGNGDTDGDGIPDYLDLDSDGDGISDADEGNVDTDGDGIIDAKDLDSDNDGINDSAENGDFNKDGINDRLQAFGKVESTYKGSGSMTLWMIIMLIGVCIIRRQKALGKQRFLKPLTIIVVALTGSASMLAQADTNVETELSENYFQSDNSQDCRRKDKTDTPLSCWYVGLTVAKSYVYPDNNNTIWEVNDNNDTAYAVNLGYSWSQHWFAELAYAELGEATLISRNPSLTEDLRVDYKGFSTDIGYWLRPRDQSWNIYLKAGLGFLKTKANLPKHHEQVESTQIRFGLGLEWNIAQQWFLRIEHSRYDKDARLTGLSLSYRFNE